MAKTVGLKTEILLTLMLLLGAALLLGGIMMLRLMEESLLKERASQLDSLVQVLSQVVSTESIDRSPLYQLPKKVNCKAWWVYDRNLNLLDSHVKEKSLPLAASIRQLVRITGESQQKIDFPSSLNWFGKSTADIRFVVPLKSKSHFSGVLELHFSLADIRLNLLRSQQLLLIYIFLYGAVLVLAGYYLLQRNIIKPARNLLSATENVSRGNLETRLPSAGPTEILRLAVAFNHMVEALQESRNQTERHIFSLEEMNSQLQQARDDLIRSEKLASVGQLAAGLAHEVGNPLSALIGYLELLKPKVKSAGDSDIVKRALTETIRIDFLVRELLDFSRPADSCMLESVDMVAEMNFCIQLLQNQGSASSIVITNELPEALSVIRINRHRLQQVFINLLLNAVQACGQHGKITLSAGVDETTVWMEIKDNGCGIAKANINKVFDPFFTTKKTGEGTGLGLAICHRIIEEGQGSIVVESNLGVGSSFRLTFPKET